MHRPQSWLLGLSAEKVVKRDEITHLVGQIANNSFIFNLPLKP